MNSSKKRTNEFVFTTMKRVFVRFLEEIEDSKKTFQNYLTFKGEQRTEEEARIEKGRKTLVTMLVVEDNFQNLNFRLGIQTKVPC